MNSNAIIVSRRLALFAPAVAGGAQAATPRSPLTSLEAGLFLHLGMLSVPRDMDLIETSGHTVTGVGAARYMETARSGETSYRKRTADGRWFELLPDPEGVSPQQLGARADFDKVTGIGSDDSQAFEDWVDFCMSRGGFRAWPGRLQGDYMISRNNILGSWKTNSGFVRDWQIVGTGLTACSITFRPNGNDNIDSYFLYDGLDPAGSKSAVNSVLGLRLAGCELCLDARAVGANQKISWFRQSGWSVDLAPQQGWVFERVFFRGDHANPSRIGAILEIVGTANGSENAFNLCRGYWWGHVITCDNPQAVNHLSNFCHWELGFGDAFRFTCGGALTVIGGSLILDNQDALPWEAGKAHTAGEIRWFDGCRYRAIRSGTSGNNPPTHNVGIQSDGAVPWRFEADESFYLLRLGGNLKGQSNNFAFYGPRIELRSCRAKLLGGGDLNTDSHVLFSAASVQAVIGGYRTSISLSECGIKAKFDDCMLVAPGGFSEPIIVRFGSFDERDLQYVFRARSSPEILLDNCTVSPAIHELVSWRPGATGVFRMIGCSGVSVDAADAASSPDILFDCDMPNPSQAFTAKGSASRSLKSKFVNFASYFGRHDHHSETGRKGCVFVLPPGAILKRIHISNANVNGSQVPVSLDLEYGDGARFTRCYTFLAALFDGESSLDSGDIMKTVAPTNRYFRIIASNDVGQASQPQEPGDYVLVEYY